MLDNAEELAKFLNVSVASIRKLTRISDMPRVRIGRAVRFDRAAVLEWSREVNRTRGNGAEVGETEVR